MNHSIAEPRKGGVQNWDLNGHFLGSDGGKSNGHLWEREIYDCSGIWEKTESVNAGKEKESTPLLAEGIRLVQRHTLKRKCI